MLYLLTLALILILVLSTFFLGELIDRLFKLNWGTLSYLPIGFIFMIGAGNLLAYPIVFFELNANILYGIYTLFILIGFIGILFTKLRLKKINKIFVLTFFAYLIIMIYVSSQRALGEYTFDTVHYLSLILEESNATFFTQYDLNSGGLKTYFDRLDDFQTYYYFIAMFVKGLEMFVAKYSEDIIPIVTPVFIWGFTIYYYILNFFITGSILERLSIKSKLLKISLGAFVLLFIGNFYYYNIFSFYGNSYRSLFAAFMMFIMYHYLEQRKHLIGTSFVLMVTSSALIASSSSGYFIGFFMLYAFVLIIQGDEAFKQRFGLILMLLTLPTVMFVNIYFHEHIDVLIPLSSGAYMLLILINYSGLKLLRDIFLWSVRIVSRYLVPLAILVYSLYLIKSGFQPIGIFFKDNKVGDMVWNYFDFVTPLNLFVNSLYMFALVYFIVKSKSQTKYLLLLVIGVFINPISIQFVYRFLTDKIFYRAYESVFNNFSVLLILAFLFNSIKKGVYEKVAISLLAIFVSIISVFQMSSYYTWFFIPRENYNPFYKLENNQVEVFEFLKTTMILQGYERARVISQIPTIKGYVPNIMVPISFNYYRSIDKYVNTNKAPSPMYNIFMHREYIEQAIYDTPPDYENTCKYIIDYQADFVVVDKYHSYMVDGDYKFLYHRVRGCGTQIFENDLYFIYQLYW